MNTTTTPTTTTTATDTTEMVYAPRAVIYGKEHAHEGGGGLCIPKVQALSLGATNIRPAKGGFGYVADWPQHYFEA